MFGGGNKSLVGDLLVGDFFQMGEDDKFLKQTVQIHTPVNLQNLLNGWQAIVGFIGKWFKRLYLVSKNVKVWQDIISPWETGDIKQIRLSIKDKKAYYCS